MSYGSVICLATLLVAGARPALASLPIHTSSAPLTQSSDRPARTYVIQGKPSDVVQNHEAVLALARQLEASLKADVRAVPRGADASAARRNLRLYPGQQIYDWFLRYDRRSRK